VWSARTDCPERDGSARIGRAAIYRDAVYEEFDRYVELDGRLFHDSSAQRDIDLDRDLDASTDGQLTVRLGWGQVYDRPCRTAARLERFFQSGGWTGSARECGPDCRLRGDTPVVATYQAR
jgi:hypothetical protein